MKIGEGTYAVVYKGQLYSLSDFSPSHRILGRQASNNRQIAIKKIKVGQMKEGLDQSAIREVRYLRELQHPNVIEVCTGWSSLFNNTQINYNPLSAPRRLFLQNQLKSGS